jgi:rhodanese-related sulfurtransferase
MPIPVEREEVQRLATQERAQVVEVLPQPEYEWAHLSGAIHLPLKELDAERAAALLQRDRPVVVYCNDLQCDMSPRAGWRLERLGYPRVYDYAAGKMDWLSYGLPHEGSAVLAGDQLQPEVPTCTLDDPVELVRKRLGNGGLCVAVDDDNVVMGAVDQETLAAAPADARIDDVMVFGITTVRPSEDAAALSERMQRRNVGSVLVTSSDGRLLGLFHASHT